MRRLFFFALVNVAQAIAGFGAVWAFTRLLSPEDYGRYALVLSASMLAHACVFTWIEAAAFRFLPEARERAETPAHFATVIALALATALAAALLTGATLFLLRAEGAILPAAALAAVSAFARSMTRIARESERAEDAFERYASRESFYTLAGFALGAILCTTTKLGPAAPFAGAAVAGLIIAASDLRRLASRAKGDGFDARRALRYGRYGAPLALALALDLGMQTGLRGVIVEGAGEAALGAYAAAYGVAWRTLDLLFAWAGPASAPLLVAAWERRDENALRGAAFSLARIVIGVGAPAAVGLALVSPSLCAVMIGDALAPAASRVAPWLAIAALFSGLATHYASEAYQLTHRTLTRAAFAAAPAFAAVVLAVFLTRIYGPAGAAMAVAAGAATSFACLVAGARKLVPGLLPPLNHVVRCGLAVGVMTLAVALVPSTEAPLELALKSIVGAMVYAAAAFTLNVFELRTQSLRWLQRVSPRAARVLLVRGV